LVSRFWNARPNNAKVSSGVAVADTSRIVSSAVVRHGQCRLSTRWSAPTTRRTMTPRGGTARRASGRTSSMMRGGERTNPQEWPAVACDQAEPGIASCAASACVHQSFRPGAVW
jgi:hypothetical protein